MHVLLERRIFGADDLEHWTATLSGAPCHAWLVPDDVLPQWSRLQTFHYDDGRVILVDHPAVGIDLLTLVAALHHERTGTVDPTQGYFRLEAPLPVATASAIVLEVARALPAHSHRNRSISPLGVLFGADGRVRLVPPELVDVAKTMFTSWVGNPIGRIKLAMRYASREAALAVPLTPAADAFSLAVMLYELSTGRHPFLAGGDTDFQFLEAVVKRMVEPPSQHVPELSGRFDELLVRALASSDALRFRDPAGFAGALASIVPMTCSPSDEVRAFVQRLWPRVASVRERWSSPFCLDPFATTSGGRAGMA